MSGSMIPRFRHSERGAAVVEFAVVLPLLLTFLFGIMEWGRIMSVSHALNNAARAGARIGCLPGASNTKVLNAIDQVLSASGLSTYSYELSPSDVSTAARDSSISVTVRVDYEAIGLVVGYFPMFNGMQLTGSVVMRKEGFT